MDNILYIIYKRVQNEQFQSIKARLTRRTFGLHFSDFSEILHNDRVDSQTEEFKIL